MYLCAVCKKAAIIKDGEIKLICNHKNGILAIMASTLKGVGGVKNGNHKR